MTPPLTIPRGKNTDHEGPIHRAILEYLRLSLPGAVIHHSPNEFGMAGAGIGRQIAKAKWNGMIPGWPDLEIFYRGRAIFFEVKAEGGITQPAQTAVGEALRAAGCNWAVVRSMDDVRERLAAWGVPTTESLS